MFLAALLTGWCTPGLASERDVRIVVAPPDHAHPTAPRRAVVRLSAPVPLAPPEAAVRPRSPPARPGVGPRVDDTPIAVDNPFAGARERVMAAHAAAAPPPVVDDRVLPDVAVPLLALSLPRPRACRTATARQHHAGVNIEGVGLSPAQLGEAVGAFLPTVGRCLPAGTRGTFEAVAAFTVGCDGVVDQVALTARDRLTPSVVACIEHALARTPFPPHDRPGGELFEMPLRFTGPVR